MTNNTNLSVQTGIVKQVLSGDTVVVREQPRGGPPPERTICLANINAGKLSRRPNAGSNLEIKDEPYAWEAREFLRKKLIGKEICFVVEYKAPGTGREYGSIFAGKDTSCENVAESLILEGFVEVRRANLRSTDENQHRLIQLEESAKAAGKGKWGPTEEVAKHVRDVKWNLDNPNHFVDSLHQKPVNAIVEHVRDGSTVRLFVLPSFHYVTVMMSGIKSPMFKMEGEKSIADPFAEEARFFTEARLLNRDVQVILEGVVNQNIMGTILHPNGNISELLLKEGFARCADWSMGFVKQGADKLRAAEKTAKENRKRLWKDYKPSSSVDIKDKSFTAKVTEVINGDALMVKLADGTAKKIFLSSIRSPRPLEDGAADEGKRRDGGNKPARSRPLYDIPYMFEAREYLRKKLIGKKVNVLVDYIQPKSDQFPEKTGCTVTISDINVAEALVSKGLATVIRYRADDDRRSSQYDRLLAAEKQSEKKGVGVHNKKEQPMLKVADVAGDVGKAKQFLPFLQRAGRSEAIVEFVSSGSRTRLYIPKETCLVTFLISGIDCPKPSRPDPENPSNQVAGDPYGEQALEFTKDLILQHEVDVEVETMDKGGNFIGWLFIEGTNLSVALVEAGLAKVHFTAERSHYFKALNDAQERARAAKLNIWANYEPAKEVPVEVVPTERVVNQKTVTVTEICTDLHFYVQYTDSSAQLDKAMEQMRAELRDNPPVTGAYTPKKGDLCAAKFTDGEWYRAKVEKVDGKKVYVFYVDFGNREVSEAVRLAVLPASFTLMSPQAHECALACISLPPDDEDVNAALDTLCGDILNRRCLVNVEYRREGVDYVSVQLEDSHEDVAARLLSQGLLLAENRRDKHLAPLVSVYCKAQEKAKSERVNLWRYGDFTADDAPEFGMK